MRSTKNNKRKKQSRTRKPKYDLVQKIILGIIAACFLVVIFYLIYSLINRPENRVPRLISEISEDYYENYLYEKFSKSDSFKNDPDKTMELYSQYGFTPVDLKTLLLYDNQKNAKYSEELRKYCSVEATSVKFYPESPYGKKDYRVEYSYSCEF